MSSHKNWRVYFKVRRYHLVLFAFIAVMVLIVADVIFLRHLLSVSRSDDGQLAGNNIDFTLYDNITGFPYMIVPNIVHLIIFRKQQLDFTEMVNIQSVHRNQSPDRILIHCDCSDLRGPYWEIVRNLSGLELRYLREPRSVFGRSLSSVYHAADVARLYVLRQYGGIFVDSDVYLVRSLDSFRKFEFTIGWPIGESIGNQVLIANKQSRFLKLWLESYRHYRPFLWYYNAGQLPTDSILAGNPGLVHRVPTLLGVHLLVEQLYKARWPQWRTFYTIHLLTRHRSYLDAASPIKEFNAENIKVYPYTYGEMARKILYNTTDFVT